VDDRDFYKGFFEEIRMKSFIFLYPIPEIIDFEIQNHGWSYSGGESAFRQKYKEMLNKCIDLRYRQTGFEINFALFDNHEISDVVDVQKSDRIVRVGMDFRTHTTRQRDGICLYPDQDFILSQLNGTRTARIAGFHLWDCVERLAKRAYEKGLDVMVDEDLTELFSFRILCDKNFNPGRYPTFNPRESGSEESFRMFMEARKERPWLWQDY